MIYVLIGTDTEKKNTYIEKLAKNYERISVEEGSISNELFLGYATTASLFGGVSCIVADGVLSESDVVFSKSDLVELRDSNTIFVFKERVLTQKDQRKYGPYATVESFDKKISRETPKANPFAIADAFARKDKIGAWILYREAIKKGVEPESISGMLFWKIKTLILTGTRVFSISDLETTSRDIVSLYHRAHRGECDFTIGLEQFLLTSLSK